MGPKDSLRTQAERLDSQESITCLLSYCALHRVTLPTTLFGKADPESRLYLGRQIPSLTFPELFRFTVLLGPEHLGGPHPHSWQSSRRLNFLLALLWVEGQRGVSAPTPPPSSGFCLETDCAASSSHHCHCP